MSDFEAEIKRNSVSVFTLPTMSLQDTFFAWLMKRTGLKSSRLHPRSMLSKLVTGKVNGSSAQLPAYTRPQKNSVVSNLAKETTTCKHIQTLRYVYSYSFHSTRIFTYILCST